MSLSLSHREMDGLYLTVVVELRYDEHNEILKIYSVQTMY